MNLSMWMVGKSSTGNNKS